MKLAQHQYSAMFGTFLFNNYLELLKQNEFSIQQSGLCFDKDSVDKNNTATLISVFDYLNKQNPTFINPVFDPRKTSRLACPGKIWELQIYRQVYCCSSVEENVNNPVSLLNAHFCLFNSLNYRTMFVPVHSTICQFMETIQLPRKSQLFQDHNRLQVLIHWNKQRMEFTG